MISVSLSLSFRGCKAKLFHRMLVENFGKTKGVNIHPKTGLHRCNELFDQSLSLKLITFGAAHCKQPISYSKIKVVTPQKHKPWVTRNQIAKKCHVSTVLEKTTAIFFFGFFLGRQALALQETHIISKEEDLANLPGKAEFLSSC